MTKLNSLHQPTFCYTKEPLHIYHNQSLIYDQIVLTKTLAQVYVVEKWELVFIDRFYRF